MIVIPKEKPVHNQLSTYYLHLDKFFEYSKREQSSGCLYFTATSTKGVVFFDTDEILNTVYVDGNNGESIDGGDAFTKLLDAVNEQTFQVAVYKIELNHIYSWVGLHKLNPLDDEFPLDTSSLDKLVNQLQSLDFSGYIEAKIDKDEGLLIFQDGKFVCGSYSWGDGNPASDENNLKLLIEKSNGSTGNFIMKGTMSSEHEFFDAASKSESKIEKAPSTTIATLEELLDIFSRVVDEDVDIDTDFPILLKDKFVEKADRYSFLDPFANEFKFVDQKIKYTGNASDEELTKGVAECVRELADELGVLQLLKQEITTWSTYLGDDIKKISANFL